MPRDNQDQLGWGNHDVVATGLNDGTKQVSVNAWNDSTDQSGLFGFVKQSGTISGNAIVPTGSVIEIQLDGTLNTLTTTNNNEFDLIYLIGKSGEDAITITHNASGGSGNIRLLGGASKTLSTTVPLILMARTIGANLEWLEYGGGATVDAGDLTGTTLASGVVTSSLTAVGTIATGTWTGTAVGDTYISSASTWNGKQDALTFGISNTNVTKAGSGIVDDDFIRVDGTTFEGRSASEVLSDIGGQASLTFGIADTNAVKIDGSGTATGEYAKFTATGVIGEEVADVKTDLSLNNVENTALSTWTGTSNIATVGTIGTGTWNGTAVDVSYLASNAKTQAIMFAVSDEATALTTGTGKLTFRMPYAMTLFAGVSGIKASLTTAGSTSGVTTVDVNEAGSTILSTKLTIDSGETTSTTASTPPVISDTALASDAIITVDIDGLSGGATEAGLKITLIGIPA